jgi:hypothetical protein
LQHGWRRCCLSSGGILRHHTKRLHKSNQNKPKTLELMAKSPGVGRRWTTNVFSEVRRKRRTYNGGWADCIVCRVDSFRRIIEETDSLERGGQSIERACKEEEAGTREKKIRERVDDETMWDEKRWDDVELYTQPSRKPQRRKSRHKNYWAGQLSSSQGLCPPPPANLWMKIRQGPSDLQPKQLPWLIKIVFIIWKKSFDSRFKLKNVS